MFFFLDGNILKFQSRLLCMPHLNLESTINQDYILKENSLPV